MNTSVDTPDATAKRDSGAGSKRRVAVLDRAHARFAGLSKAANGFVSQPEPRTIGRMPRGRQLTAGNFLFAGSLIEAPNRSLWNLPIPDAEFEEEIHGFGWLDDLAAIAEGDAKAKAQDWTFEWIARYGKGRGPGWVPDLTGRRVIRWINHAIMLLGARDKVASDAFFASLSRQVIFLSRRWKSASPGLARFEALSGLAYAGLSLMGMERHVRPAVAALGVECRTQIDAEGGLPTRNPEELLEVFQLLVWAASALTETGNIPDAEHTAAIERIAPTLRNLRHADGGLARFHGGGRGQEGVLDAILATSGVRARAPQARAMGFSRLSAGRTSVIVDTASPPKGRPSAEAHASTCGFELTSGRRPLIVNCGSGRSFGQAWRRAGRATPSHSVLGMEGYSSARLGPGGFARGGAKDYLIDVPERVEIERSSGLDGERLQVSHDGWRKTHGLTYARTLDLTPDGRTLVGEEMLTTLTPADQDRFERVMTAIQLQGIPLELRFHLHPDVSASIDLGGSTISLALKSGEIWVFRQSEGEDLALEPSVYLEMGRLKPRAAQQIVVRARARIYTTSIKWSLAKAQETPLSVRDIRRDDWAEQDQGILDD